ncbi:helix-turn-helix domain-containing protein [Nonomuraea sp. NPDC050404]|uniref:Crp/Fnr family transcriptional regulator n=1 Tax=Nonomuraea sp. NPDC050404 TaxID=3155783 RepID=UPI0033C116E6
MDRLPLQRAGQINFWRHLSQLERDALARIGTERPVEAGEVVPVREERGITIVTTGSWIRLQAGRARASRSVIDLAAPGDLVSALHPTDPAGPPWLGEMAEIYGIVLTRGTILDVAQDMIPIVFGDLPHIQALIRTIQADQLHFARQLQAVRRLKIDVRLSRLLLGLLYRFGERPMAKRNVLAAPLSQADLAAWTGSSETSVGRILKKWRCDGLVRSGYSWISVEDRKGLRDIANSSAVPYARFPAPGRRRMTAGPSTSVQVAAGLDLTTDLPPGLHARDRTDRYRG